MGPRTDRPTTRRARGRAGARPPWVLPLVAALAVIAVGVVTAGSAYLSLASTPAGVTSGPTLAATSLTDPDDGVTLAVTWATAVVLVGGYLVACFTGTLFAAATVASADARRRRPGGAGTCAEGLRAAALHAPQLAAWSLVAATVGVVARQFGHRGLIGAVLGHPTRRDWNDATALVLPLIVLEGARPRAAWRTSRALAPTPSFEPDDLPTPTTPLALGAAVLAGAALWPASPLAALVAAGALAVYAYVEGATATAERRRRRFEQVRALAAPAPGADAALAA